MIGKHPYLLQNLGVFRNNPAAIAKAAEVFRREKAEYGHVAVIANPLSPVARALAWAQSSIKIS